MARMPTCRIKIVIDGLDPVELKQWCDIAISCDKIGAHKMRDRIVQTLDYVADIETNKADQSWRQKLREDLSKVAP